MLLATLVSVTMFVAQILTQKYRPTFIHCIRSRHVQGKLSPTLNSLILNGIIGRANSLQKKFQIQTEENNS